MNLAQVSIGRWQVVDARTTLTGGPLSDLAVSVLYVLSYVCLEWATRLHELAPLGITLWNPAPALTLMLLLKRGLIFAPLAAIAAMLANYLIYGAPNGFGAALLMSLSISGGYAALSAVLKHVFRLRLQTLRMRDTIYLIAVIPFGSLLVAAAVCGSLVAVDALPMQSFVSTALHYWVGDAVGTLVLLPVLITVTDPALRHVLTPSRDGLVTAAVFLTGLALALWIIFGLPETDEFKFFYLLFIPLIWGAVRQGFAGVAMAILATHLALQAVLLISGHQSGDVMAFQFLMAALAGSGLLLGMAITERQRLERLAMLQQVELARTARATTAGALGVALAHQISQPISTVSMYVHVAQDQLRNSTVDPQKTLDTLGKASSELTRARKILEGIRDFVSRGRLDSQRIDLRTVCQNMVNIVQPEASACGVALGFEAPRSLWIDADAVQIEQVLVNVLSNAIDAAARPGPDGGNVTIRLVDLTDAVRIEIDDDGQGLSPEIEQSLFEPFVSSKPRGMGLGLHLSRLIVESHGGKISWHPLEPSGTRFSITFRKAADHG